MTLSCNSIVFWANLITTASYLYLSNLIASAGCQQYTVQYLQLIDDIMFFTVGVANFTLVNKRTWLISTYVAAFDPINQVYGISRGGPTRQTSIDVLTKFLLQYWCIGT